MIIDAHAHSDFNEWLGFIDDPDRVVGIMDSAGIDKAVVSTYGDAPDLAGRLVDFIEEGARKHPDRLIPFVRINPGFGEKAQAVVRDAVENRGFRGIKLHPVGYSLSAFGEDTRKILRIAAHYDIPVLFHCSEDVKSAPWIIGFAAQQEPDTKIILGHMGGFFLRDDAIKVCLQNKNVYLETCETPFVDGIRHAVEALGPERILFGTDIPSDNPLVEIEKIRAAKLGAEAEEFIFWKNAARILNLKIKEVDE